MKRTKQLHGSGAHALTPRFSDAEIAELPEHTKKGCLLYFLESLQRRVAAQQEIIQQQQDHIDRLKRLFKEEGNVLFPSETKRPAKKGQF